MKKTTKPNLFEESVKEVVSEAFGGTPMKGSGTFSWGSQTGSKTWAHQSPQYRSMTGGPTSSELFGIIAAEEEETHKAPPRKPYPLETVDDELVKAFLALGNVESQLRSCAKFNAVITSKKSKQKVLEFLHDKVKGIRVMIKNVSEELDRINLS